MPPFINRVWMQGQIVTSPIIKALNPRTNLAAFQFAMVESWTNDDGEQRDRKNRITVEVVGRDAGYVAATAKVGTWATIEGYLRSEQFKGQDLIKIRTFSIHLWEAHDGTSREAAGGHRGEPVAPLEKGG
jgi:single-stranded DNA-binding protein